MYKSKRFSYTYEDWDEGGKDAKTMVEDILKDSELSDLDEIVIGCWGECWDDNDGAQEIIDGIVANKEKFSHIKSLFIGDMDYEDCEVSWIIQGNYSKLWAAMPQLEKLVIKGSTDLELGEIQHRRLQHLLSAEDFLRMSFSQYRKQNCHLFRLWCCILVLRSMGLTEIFRLFRIFWQSLIFLSYPIWELRTARFRMRLRKQY